MRRTWSMAVFASVLVKFMARFMVFAFGLAHFFVFLAHFF